MAALSLAFLGLPDLHAVTGSDNAGNYSSWSSGDNQGTGFGPWTFENVNGGWFLGDPTSRASNLGAPFTTSGNTFGLWSSGDGTLPSRFAKALRSFASPLATNDRFKISLGYQWDNGNRGFNLYDGSSEVFNLNINATAMTWTGGGSYGVIPWSGKRELGAQVDVTIIKTATGFRYAISSPQDSGLNGNGSVIASGLSGFAVYVSGAGGDPKADFNFNNLLLDTVPGDVTPPTITLLGDKLVQVAVGGTYTPPNPAVTVSDDVTATANIVVTPGPLDTASAGLKTITYTAKDEANNSASVTRIVLVGDLTASTTDTFYNLNSPATLTLNPISSGSVYGQIYVKGATQGDGQAPNIQAWVGVNTANTDPSTWTDTVWKPAAYNPSQTGNNDEYSALLIGADYTPGNTYYYATRWQVGAGAYAYGGTSGPWNGTTSVSGVLTVLPVRNVSFAVNMNVQIAKGVFKPNDGQGVELKGSFNNWGPGIAMSDSGQNGIYTLNLPVQGNSNSPVQYKFRITGGASDGTEWERVDIPRSTDAQTQSVNREFLLAVPGQEQVVSSVAAPSLFSFDDGVGPVITLSCDYLGGFTSKIQIEENSVFENPTVTSAVDVAEKNSDYQSALSKPSVDTVDPSIPGSYSLVYSVSDGNKNLSTRTVEVVVLPSRFTAWSQGQSTLATLNPEILAKYAIGGANTLTAQGEAPKVGTGFIVPNHYSYIEAIVRTDDSKLTIVGEASTDLDAGFASTGTWTTRGQADGVSQLDVPNGCERKRFIYWHGMVQERMFLRLRATLNP